MQLDKYVGKYVDITLPNGDGGSGWVKEIVKEESTGTPWVVFDYGYGFPILNEESIVETTPPPNDPEMLKE